MKLNKEKCKVLYQGSNTLRHQYMLEATQLESSLSEKDLGGHQVEHEPTQCPCSKEGKLYPGLHYIITRN